MMHGIPQRNLAVLIVIASVLCPFLCQCRSEEVGRVRSAELRFNASCVIRKGESPDVELPCAEWRLEALQTGRFGCSNLLGKVGDRWIIDDTAIKAAEGDIQVLIDCIPDGDVVAFAWETMRLKKTLNLTRPITIGSATPGHAASRTRVNCPKNQPAFEIRAKEVAVYNLTFSGCTLDGPSIMELLPGSDVTLVNTGFTNNTNAGGPGCISAEGVLLRVQDCSFLFNSGVDGGAIGLKGNSALSVIGTSFQQNSGRKGGAVQAEDSGIAVSESAFLFNEAREFGGAIDIEVHNHTLLLDIRNVEFLENKISGSVKSVHNTRSGGAVSIRGPVLSHMSGSKFYYNSALIDGGAILAEGCKILEVSNTSFYENHASQGSAISVHKQSFADVNMTVLLSDVYFKENRAGENRKEVNAFGGAMSVLHADVFRMQRAEFVNNTALDNGGGLVLLGVQSAAISDCAFVHNYAYSGGGMEVDAGNIPASLTMDNVSFTMNAANTSAGGGGGAAIFWGDLLGVEITNSVFDRNSANDGGALWVGNGADLLIKQSVFRNNNATTHNGGAIFVWSVPTSTNLTAVESAFLNNTATLAGGAIYFKSVNSTLSLAGGMKFIENTAGQGGALWVSGTQGSVDLGVKDSVFMKNVATTLGTGGLTTVGKVSSNLENVTFDHNRGHHGGAMNVFDKARMTIKLGRFIENHAAASGGAIYFEHNDLNDREFQSDENMVVVIDNSVFARNSAGEEQDRQGVLSATSLTGGGGAIFVAGAGTDVTLNQTVVENNTAISGGGIYWQQGGEMQVRDCEISSNEAALGGGMYANTLETVTKNFTMDRVKFAGNTAQSGGGLSLSVVGSPFLNLANLEYRRGRVATLIAVEFLNNTASNHGGAVHLEEIWMSCRNCTFTHNKAGYDGAKFGALGTGGAINVGRNAIATLNASIVGFNSAHQGGGICVEDGALSCNAVDFKDNVAKDVGGAVALKYGASVTTPSGSLMGCKLCNITGNQAIVGGGIHLLVERPQEELADCVELEEFGDKSHRRDCFHDMATMCSGRPHLLDLLNSRHVSLQHTELSDNHAQESGAAIFSSDPNHIEICCGDECHFVRDKSMRYPCQDGIGARWHNNTVTGPHPQTVISTVISQVELSPGRIEKHASGRPLPPISIVLRDPLGQVVSGRNVSLVVKADEPNMISGSFARGILLQEGKSTLTDITVRAAPGNYTLEFIFSLEVKGRDAVIAKLPVEVRSCWMGEILDENSLSCIECERNTSYSFNTTGVCSPCPPHAQCNGSTLTPTPGYWHSTSQSVTLAQCLLERACSAKGRTAALEKNGFGAHREGRFLDWQDGSYDQCVEGYTGPLCGSCTTDHGRMGTAECGHCPGKVVSIGLVVLTFASLIGIAAYLTKEALQYEKRIKAMANLQEPAHSRQPSGYHTSFTTANSHSTPQPTLDAIITVDGDRARPMSSGAVSAAGSWNSYEIGRSPSHQRSISCSRNFSSRPRWSFSTHRRVFSCYYQSFSEYVSMGDIAETSTLPPTDASVAGTVPGAGNQDVGSTLTANRLMEVFKILINFLQVIGTAASINAHWTKSVFKVLAMSDYVTGVSTGSGLLSIECAFGATQIARSIKSYALQSLTPFTVWIVFAIYWIIKRWRKKLDGNQLMQRFIVGLVVILYVSYISMTKRIVRMYNCVHIDVSTDPEQEMSLSFWAEDTSVECYRGWHAWLVGLIGTPLLVCVVAGYPLCLTLKFLLSKARYNNPDFIGRYGFLYKAYREEASYWEAFVMMRKGLLATIVVFSGKIGPANQGTLAVAVLLLALLLHNYFKPYDESISRLNMLESISLGISALTFLCGVSFTQNEGNMCMLGVLSTVVIGGVAGFVIFLAYELEMSGVEVLQAWMIENGLTLSGRLFEDVKIASKYVFENVQKKLQEDLDKLLPSIRSDGSGSDRSDRV